MIDFETTGLDLGALATEVAIATFDRNFKVVDRYESIVNPLKPIAQLSLGYARLTKSEIAAAPVFADLWPAISKLLSGRLLVMHNAKFDKAVLRNELSRVGYEGAPPATVCTLVASKRVFPALKSHQLSDVATHLGIELPDAHSAMVDVDMTAKLFAHLHRIDAAFRRECGFLAEDAVHFAVNRPAKQPAPRQRFVSGLLDERQLTEIVQEISRNALVKTRREVCRTGDLAMREEIESTLDAIGFTLEDKEPTKGTAFLIQGAKAGQRKVAKAQHYGRPVLDESEALQVVKALAVKANNR